MMISCAFISLSCVSISSLASVVTSSVLHWWDVGIKCYEGFPGIIPILSNESVNIVFKSLMLWIVLWSLMEKWFLYSLEKG